MSTTTHPTHIRWVTSEDWATFHRLWWGSAKDLIVNSDFDVGRDTEESSTALDTEGRVFIRQEYQDFYQRLKKACDEKAAGRTVSGSPGIGYQGKSVFLLYILAKRLKDQQVTLFFNSSSQLQLFYRDGVYDFAKSPDAFRPSIHLVPLLSDDTRVWILIDSARIASSPPLPLTRSRLLFPIQAAPPDQRYYKEWFKQNEGTRLVMNPWSVEELRAALALHPNLTLSEDAVRKAREDFGPCIRDVISGLLAPATLAAEIASAIADQATISLPQLISEALDARRPDGMVASVSHVLFFIQRLHPDISNSLGPDAAFVDVKTMDIATSLRSKHAQFTLAESFELYQRCCPFPEASILAGWLFEKIAIECLSGNIAQRNHLVKEMYMMKPLSTCDTPSFVHMSSNEDTSELRVGPWTSESVSGDRLLPIFSRSDPVTLPINLRYIASLEELVFPDPQHFYVPKAKDHPLLDAAFFSSHSGHPTQCTLWVLQLTLSPRHASSERGYTSVLDLRSRFLRANPGHSCVVKYVLVVPERRQQRIVWTFPSGWQGPVIGEVYVQFINMDRLT